MKKFNNFLLPLMILSLVGTTLPIFAGYLVAFVLLIWLCLHRWKPARLSVEQETYEFDLICTRVFRPMLWGTICLTVCFVGANLLANAFSEVSLPWGEVMGKMSHFLVKYLLLPYVVVGSWMAVTRKGMDIQRGLIWILLWIVVLVIYLVAQRQWGIDWVHGFDAHLGVGRLSSGVYRTSGFMGHPLTLAYVTCLWIFFSFEMHRRYRSNQEISVSRKWLGIFGLMLASLLIGGGRFPLVVILIVPCLVVGRAIRNHAKLLTLGIIFLVVGLYFEGSLVGRMFELFDTNHDLAQKFPRVFFWQVHWNIFWDYPFFGSGLLQSKELLPLYYQEIGYHDKIYTAHNIYLQFLADSGIIGFVGLICFLSGFVFAARNLHTLTGSSGLWQLVLVTVFAGLMQNILRDSEYIISLWILSSVIVVQAARGGIRQETNASDQRTIQNGKSP